MNLYRGQKVKGKGHQDDKMLSQTMKHTQVKGITIFLKLACFIKETASW